MPLTDMPLEALEEYRPAVREPEDFDEFWEKTLAAAGESPESLTGAEFRAVESPLRTLDVLNVRFPGWGGQPVAAWLVLPRGAAGPLPAVVSYVGYGGGRGLHTEHLLYASAGYAHLVVDSRGQGHATPDPDPVPTPQYVRGFMTLGAASPQDHYFRRLITDCARALDAVRAHPAVDPGRLVVQGHSQGGGLALAVAGLVGDGVAAALVDAPFLCHIRRGAETAFQGPYTEIAEFLGIHQGMPPETVLGTLDYFDGVHFAPRATAPALFSVGLMDPVCPPSTVFAAYNRYGTAGDAAPPHREISVWPYGDHAAGRHAQATEQFRWLGDRGIAPDRAPEEHPAPH
ncbi:acetylxylan esterase [Streptomyces sulphureus]|uniref:acetylxylan esterase n=1 Tax=Streptomyces sulphureus TaxID=47758 RepID=UPI000382C4BC|nr:alpha/beta fold hydrolase [Streptomyces sulphureus]